MKKKLKNFLNIVLYIISFFLFFRFSLTLIKLIRINNLNDFTVYYYAAKDSLKANPYIGKYFAPYNYPPSATLFFLSLTILPYKLAEFLWLFSSVVFLFLAVFLILKLFNRKTSFSLIFFIGNLLLYTFPSRFTLVLGQINLIILIFIVLSIYFFQKGRKGLAGLFLGIAGALKLTPLTLSTFYFFKKEKKTFLIPFLFFSAMNLISGILLGFNNFFYYFKVVFPLLMQGDISRDIHVHYFNQSLAAFLFDLKFSPFWQSFLRWLITGLSVFFIARKFAKKNNPLENLRSFSLLLIVFCIFSPSFTWTHHYVFLFPALLSLFLFFKKKPTFLKAFFSGLFVASFTFYFKDSSSPQLLGNILLRSHTFFSAVSLFIALLVI